MHHHVRRGLAALLLPATALFGPLAACGGDEEEAGPTTEATEEGAGGYSQNCTDEAGEATLNVRLGDFVVVPDRGEVPAGEVVIRAENIGEEFHEVVVVRGAPDTLPKAEDGSLDEDALPEGAVIGEIEGPEPGNFCSDVFDLEPGEYTLVCNVVETEPDGSIEAHFDMGMYAPLTVT